MLKRLRIKNFQKHGKVDISFDPYVTCIVGDSDAGKSSLLRALQWVVLNKPNGTDFIRNGESTCSVRLEVDDSKVTRTRGKQNKYRLEDKEYKAFGNEVPKDIQALFQLGAINFQDQHDSPFWLNDSPAQVSRNLNEIVDLGIIDTALGNAAQITRTSKTLMKVNDNRLQEALQLTEDLEWVDTANKHLIALESACDTLKAKIAVVQTLQILIQEAEAYELDLVPLQELEDMGNPLAAAVEELSDHENNLERLNSNIEEASDLKKAIKELSKKRKKLQQQLQEIEVCPTCQRPM
jgi:exonuclease SbcC